MNTNLYEKIVNENGEEIYKPYDITKTKICGKPLEEVIQILNGLDLEKEKEMLLTMNNLGEWCEMIKEEIKKEQEEAIKKFFNKEK